MPRLVALSLATAEHYGEPLLLQHPGRAAVACGLAVMLCDWPR